MNGSYETHTANELLRPKRPAHRSPVRDNPIQRISCDRRPAAYPALEDLANEWIELIRADAERMSTRRQRRDSHN